MRVRAWLTMLVTATCTVLAFSASPASASCIAPPSVGESLESADLVFVGQVVALNNRNRWATFTIDEIWKGEPGSFRVEVRGGPPSGEATSVDRAYEPDKRYLVFATKGERHWEDNACSATRLYEPSLESLRPAAARTPPTTATAPDDGVKSGTIVFAAVVLLLTVGGYLVVRSWGRNTGVPR